MCRTCFANTSLQNPPWDAGPCPCPQSPQCSLSPTGSNNSAWQRCIWMPGLGIRNLIATLKFSENSDEPSTMRFKIIRIMHFRASSAVVALNFCMNVMCAIMLSFFWCRDFRNLPPSSGAELLPGRLQLLHAFPCRRALFSSSPNSEAIGGSYFKYRRQTYQHVWVGPVSAGLTGCRCQQDSLGAGVNMFGSVPVSTGFTGWQCQHVWVGAGVNRIQ